MIPDSPLFWLSVLVLGAVVVYVMLDIDFKKRMK